MSLFSMFNRTPDADPGPSADELELERIREKADGPLIPDHIRI